MDGSLCPKGLWSRKLLYDFNIMFTSRISCTDEKNTRVFVGITAADVGNPPSDNTLRSTQGLRTVLRDHTTVHFGFVPNEAVTSSRKRVANFFVIGVV